MKKARLIMYLLTAFSAHAADYYVAPDGSDAGPGTMELPWKTIGKAAQSATAGDTVHIRGGTYPITSNISVAHSGTASNWIVFKGVAGEKAVIDASAGSFDGSTGAFSISGKEYIRVENLHIIESPGQGFHVYLGNHIDLVGNSTSNTWCSGIGVWGNSGSKIPSSYINVISNVVLKPNSWDAPGADPIAFDRPPHEAITLGRVEHFEVAYNEVAYGDKEGIDCKGPTSFGIIHHNYVHHQENHPYTVGIYLDDWTDPMQDIDVYSNIVHNCGDGIQVATEQGPSVEDIGIWDNLVYNMLWTGISVSSIGPDNPKTNIRIEGNTVRNCQAGIRIAGTNTHNVLIRNNISVENYNTDIDISASLTTVTNIYNLTSDPSFTDIDAGDFGLRWGSAAIDAGDPALTDFDGTRRDIGFRPFDQRALPPEPAFNPRPGNGSTDATLRRHLAWSPGGRARTHRVYFGTSPVLDAGDLVQESTDTHYTPGLLLPHQTYYWRIDEVNPYGTVTGTVWSFTTGSDAAYLRDDFTGTAPVDWRVEVGGWTPLGGVLRHRGNSPGLIYWGNPNAATDWSDYVIQTSMSSDDNDPMGVCFRVVDADNYYRFVMSAQDNYRLIERVLDGSVSTVATAAGGYDAGVGYRVEIAVSGSVFRVWLDGVDLFGAVNDGTHDQGTVGFYVDYCEKTRFGPVRVGDEFVYAPVADAGPDQVLTHLYDTPLKSVRLDGSGSTDDGTLISYSWRMNGAEVAVGPQPVIFLPIGTHEIGLVCTDDDGLTGSDTVTVTIDYAYADAAIAVRSTGGIDAGDAETDTATFTASNSGDPADYLVVVAVTETSYITGMTYAETPMTELYRAEADGSAYVQHFGIATTTASGTINATYSGQLFGTHVFGWLFLSHVDAQHPVRGTGQGANSSGAGTGSVSFGYSAPVEAGDAVIAGAYKNNGSAPDGSVSSFTPSTATVIRIKPAGTFSGAVAYHADPAPGSYSTTVGFVNDTNRELGGGVILAAGGAPIRIPVEQDSNGDGYSDLMEAFLGSDTNAPGDSAWRMTAGSEDPLAVLHYTEATATDRPYGVISWSTNLSDWTETGLIVSLEESLGGYDLMKASVTNPADRAFFKIEVAP